VLPEIRDVHPPLPIETNAVADTARRQRREELGLRGARRYLADVAALPKIDNVKVAGCVDRGTFNTGGVFALRRDPLTDEQGILGRVALACEENGTCDETGRSKFRSKAPVLWLPSPAPVATNCD
jgi:hypothetical protein